MRWRQAQSEERQLAWLWAAAAIAALVLRPLWLALSPLLPACPLNVLTGIPCPTCGTTRAGLALLHGDFLSALRQNPAATLAGVVFILGGVLAPLWIRLGFFIPDLPKRWPRWARLAVLGLILANWAWLVATLPPPPTRPVESRRSKVEGRRTPRAESQELRASPPPARSKVEGRRRPGARGGRGTSH